MGDEAGVLELTHPDRERRSLNGDHSTADVAAAMVDQLSGASFIRKAPFVLRR